jgi:DNA-binding MarR family transcriptional regulator
MPEDRRARIGEIAERLQIQHHSAVELVDRLSTNGLITRKRSPEDRREVLISLTSKGERVLRDLSVHHRSELRDALPNLVAILKRISGAVDGEKDGNSAKGRARK